MNIGAVIFDLDGTLWDVVNTTTVSANQIAEKHGLPEVNVDDVRRSMGQPRDGSAKMFFPYLPEPEALSLIDEVISHNFDNLFVLGGNLYPDLKDTMAILSKKYNLYIVSNTPEIRYIEAFLVSSGTKELFSGVYASGAAGITKGETIKKIKNNFQPDKAVYVGDSVLDYYAANEADVPFIWADYGFGDVPEADHRISSLNELPDVLDKLFNDMRGI